MHRRSEVGINSPSRTFNPTARLTFLARQRSTQVRCHASQPYCRLEPLRDWSTSLHVCRSHLWSWFLHFQRSSPLIRQQNTRHQGVPYSILPPGRWKRAISRAIAPSFQASGPEWRAELACVGRLKVRARVWGTSRKAAIFSCPLLLLLLLWKKMELSVFSRPGSPCCSVL